MNLKEAFRCQNRIQAFMDEATRLLSNTDNVTRVKSTLLVHKVMPESEDEVVLNEQETEYAGQMTDIARFLVFLLAEKSRLFSAIRAAKNAMPVDMDSEVSLNAARQQIAHTFRQLNGLRNSETVIPRGGTAHRFNAEGNQVPFRCDVKRVTTIDFDRNVIREALSKLNRKSDEISARLDSCMVLSQVDYRPPFDVNDTFADAFELFLKGNRAA